MPTVFPKKGRFFVVLASVDPSGAALQTLQQKYPDVFRRGEGGFDTQAEAEQYRDELKTLFQNARAGSA